MTDDKPHEYVPQIVTETMSARLQMPVLREQLAAMTAERNNLAEALESKPDRSANETFSMIGAAQAGLTYWKRAGTWLEEERAFWRLAKSRLAAGDYADAIASARDCLAVCESNDAPAFERFFGYAALAQAQRAAGDTAGAAASARTAVELHSRVPEDERHWCAAELARLSG